VTIDDLLRPLQAFAAESERFSVDTLEAQGLNGTKVRLPRVMLRGPRGGGDLVRIGLFAGIHGDEPAGCHALVHLVQRLATNPAPAEGYRLHFYPVCNPSGFAKCKRVSDSGKDLNREFWRNSSEPEVALLEKEIRSHAFHGLISLHTDDTSAGLYGFVRGAVLTRGLLEPALAAAEKVIPRNLDHVIDGFSAENGIISQCYEGILTSPPELDPAPFEIILETPQDAPLERQVQAFAVAVETVLAEYQKLLAFAANL
jgi:murein peptide amidase A